MKEVKPPMKFIYPLTALASLMACGTAPENQRGRASIALSQISAPLVKSTSDLPLCSAAKVNELVFVKDENLFKICRDQSWRDVVSADGAPGDLRVAEVAKFKSSDVDLCPDADEVLCYFEGGEYLRYSDGSIKYNARVVRKTSTQNMNDAMRSETSDVLASAMSQFAAVDNSRVKILSAIAFKGVTTGVWLVHDALSKTFSVVVDSNQDDDITESDEWLFQLELTAF